MRALDTNVVVRLFVRDDDEQTVIADALITDGAFLLLPSVLVETIWVAKSRYQMNHSKIAVELTKVLNHENAVVASPDAVAWSLKRFEAGADFADMLHFALAEELEATSFATFDRRIKDEHVAGSTVSLERLG